MNRGRKRVKSRRKIRDVAAELLDVYAQREVKKALNLNMIVRNSSNSLQPSL